MTTRFLTRLALCGALAALAACGDDDDGTPVDLGADGSTDADVPTDMFVPLDAEVPEDLGLDDLGVDMGEDLGLDAGMDMGMDACVPVTCGADQCGTIDDGCGGTVDCGIDCSALGTNGACDTATNTCECTPTTCGSDACGSFDDGCGGTLDCGTDCSALGTNGTCDTATNTCACAPSTCGADQCGAPDDGCGTALDCGVCTGLGETCGAAFTCEISAAVPTAGQVLITELMFDPHGALSDSNAEWIELFNATAVSLNLTGCTVNDASGSSGATFGSFVMPAGGYVVLARSLMDNGLPATPTTTFGFGLNNGADTVTLDCGGTTIDQVAYDDTAGWPEAQFVSISRDPAGNTTAGSADPSQWCVGSTPYYGAGTADEHRGTPGAANPACPETLPGFCRTHFPDTLTLAPRQEGTVYGRVYAAGITDRTTGTDVDADLVAELGYGARGSDAETAGWTWSSAMANPGYDDVTSGEANNDEYQATLSVPVPGDYDYAYRVSIDGGASWLYCNTGNPGTSPSTAYDPTLNGELTVTPFGSDDLAAIRAAADGTLDVAVDLVYVTYVKPAVGGDPAGVFVQAEPTGPALFLVDVMGVAVGDGITFTATEKTTVAGQTRVTVLSGLTTVTTGFAVSTLRQVVDTATDLVSDLDSYESELIGVDATITGSFGFAGSGHLQATIDTAGITGDADLRLRLPEDLVVSSGVRQGCSVTLLGAVWRFNATAQLSGWVAADLTVNSCPAPVVSGASATADDTVVVTFDNDLDPASVMASGAQFTIAGLTVSAASVSGNQVTLTTSAQTAGTSYTVTVAATVTDELGTGVDATMNSATFTGFAGAPVLIFSEYVEPSSGNDKAVEIANIDLTPVDLSSCAVIQYANGGASGSTITLSTTLAAGDVFVLCNSSATMVPNCDQTTGSLTFNGDDRLDLVCDGVVLDRFGDIEVDPGSSWPAATTVCAGSLSTANIAIARNCSVTAGYTAAAGFCPADEWAQSGTDTIDFSGFGSYTCP